MTVNFSSGQKVYASIADWDEANTKALARILETIGTAKEIRFCSVIDGAAVFVHCMVDRIDFIDISQHEYELLQAALHPPKEEKKEAQDGES
jgi:hypothetical protein